MPQVSETNCDLPLEGHWEKYCLSYDHHQSWVYGFLNEAQLFMVGKDWEIPQRQKNLADLYSFSFNSGKLKNTDDI